MNSKPCIAWNNLLENEPDLTVTHSTDATGFPFANLTDWRDYTCWKSSDTGDLFVKLDAGAGKTVTVDTLALAGHNLATAEVTGLVLQWSDDDSSYSPCFDAVTPANDRVLWRKFSARAARYFKLTIPTGYTSPPRLGVLFLGTALEFPTWPDSGFDPDAIEAETDAEYGRTGRLLGVNESFQRREIKVAFSRLPASFIADSWKPFWECHGGRPFFFAWAPEEKPEEAYLARLSTPRIESPYEGPFRSLSLTLTGTVERD